MSKHGENRGVEAEKLHKCGLKDGVEIGLGGPARLAPIGLECHVESLSLENRGCDDKQRGYGENRDGVLKKCE